MTSQPETASTLNRSPHPVQRRREPTATLTVAQAEIRYLQAQHSERDGQRRRLIPAVFGIFGHGNAPNLGQAIVQEGHELPLYQPKNEQAMVHAALGYAKATRRLSTLACTASIGPGATNTLTGAATATVNRLPVLLLLADTFASRRPGPVLQQLEHPTEADVSVNDAFRPVSRFFDRITRPEQLLTALPEAMRILLDQAETGAVTLALAQDVLGETFDWPVSFFAPRTWHVTRRPPAREELDRACDAIVESSRPLIIAGGGVRHSAAEEALAAFVNRFGIPVAETSAGKGSLSPGRWLVGGIGVNGTRAANVLAERADLVICIGTRLSDFTTGSHSLFQHEHVRFLSINVNAADANKLSAEPIVADAAQALSALTYAFGREYGGTTDAYRAEINELCDAWAHELAVDVAPRADRPRIGQGEVLQTLTEQVQAGDWVVAAAGYQPGDLLKLWTVPAGAFSHIEFGFSCMGHEIPAGLGIRLAGAEKEVFVVIGDGTYLMNPTELVTAAQERLKITVVVLDNGGYQSINHLARSSTNVSAGNEFRARTGRLPGGDPVLVDYAANARSMGVNAVRAETLDELRSALDQARKQSGTTVIVCQTDPDRPLLGSGAFWDLGVPETSTTEQTREAVVDHLLRRADRQRVI